MGRLSGKVAIITGAASGMGAKECELFAKEGASVVATDIQEELLNEVVEAINAAGGQAIAFKHDVTSEIQWKEVVALTVEKFGKVDILVNNAGVSCTSVIADIEMSEWNRVMDINLNSCVLGMKYAVPEMQKNGNGSVVNISSIGGLVGMAGTSPYTASKGALRVLSKAAAIEYGKDRVRVNSVHPGIIVTPMTEPYMEPAMPYYEAHTQLPYMGNPEDVAYGVLFLASDEARFVTGSELVIDGGWTAL
ncbi:glucose 1-dehydrogenase [Viridibacillus sp. FSL R5-0477]|uniref:Short-chain dehydrogenase/reductase SDR n=1 Tax=Viridibacillus arenosi FSL R5-213 TaxID=1227360 RepID=W4EMH0_9BACL|nr:MULTISPECIES: glucose 1-dehydrogenase [Viridibacillus]ETT81444.1 short-chain dehydrogenase/reductase SDR [Viridibacillus arenosi FSL R5-213]OMC80075.1 short-chain dehydrogenase [Viridibacillus sp. FSL H8-0123]OMC84355.1 short-chain dehydrogenase [Viridibacillus sp. FSL H7-0596]OMC89645.1 short-chain dehydrogenase [Viridibacillus arenosi]